MGHRKLIIEEIEINTILKKIDDCPIGWAHGKIRQHQDFKDVDFINWRIEIKNMVLALRE